MALWRIGNALASVQELPCSNPTSVKFFFFFFKFNLFETQILFIHL